MYNLTLVLLVVGLYMSPSSKRQSSTTDIDHKGRHLPVTIGLTAVTHF